VVLPWFRPCKKWVPFAAPHTMRGRRPSGLESRGWLIEESRPPAGCRAPDGTGRRARRAAPIRGCKCKCVRVRQGHARDRARTHTHSLSTIVCGGKDLVPKAGNFTVVTGQWTQVERPRFERQTEVTEGRQRPQKRRASSLR
jgi:hypothetical protein